MLTFPSPNHVVVIPETIWIIASFNIHKECVDLKWRCIVESRKFADGQKRNAWGEAFIVKQSADLEVIHLTIDPRRSLCKGVPQLETSYMDEWSGLQDGSGRWFEAILENLFGLKGFPRESNRYL